MALSFSQPQERLVFPLDVPDLADATQWIARLRDHVGVFKVGLELFTAAGPAAVKAVHDAGRQCFLDLKLHDIPATMRGAVQSATRMNVKYLTVHAAAGAQALKECASAAGKTQLLAVTVLTSTAQTANTQSLVIELAQQAVNAGVRGIVSSPLETKMLRKQLGDDVILVTPGIRLPSATVSDDDQQRAATPEDAIAAGASLLVVGRPIRQAQNPAVVAQSIVDSIAKASS